MSVGYHDRRWRAAIAAGFTAGLLAAPPARAQNVAGVGARDTSAASDSSTAAASASAQVVGAYAVPDMPAAAFVGATPTVIARPTTPRDFLVALANGIDQNGHARQGFSLEVSPYIIPGFQITLQQYRGRGFNPRYLLANLLASIAATQTAGDSGSTDLGYGVRTTLFDDGDPMRDTAFVHALGDSIAGCRPKSPPAGIPRPGEPQVVSDSLREVLDARRERTLRCMGQRTSGLATAYAREHWNASSVSIAYAGGERLLRSSFSNRRHIGDRVWATGALQLGTRAQALLYADYQHVRPVDTTAAYSAFSYGGRLVIGSESFNAFYELLGQARRDAPAGVQGSSHAWSGGVEFRATGSLWISTGFGKRFQELDTPDRVVLIANIRWGISTRPWLSPQQ